MASQARPISGSVDQGRAGLINLVYLLTLAGSFDHRFGHGETGAISISIAEGLAYLSAALVVIALYGEPSAARWRLLRRAFAGGWVMIAYLLWGVLAGVVEFQRNGTPEGLHALKDSMAGIILYGLMCLLISTPRRLERVQQVMLGGATLMSVLAISQYVAGAPYLAPLSETAYLKHGLDTIDLVRHPVVGMFGHPNGLAMYMVPALILCVGSPPPRIGGRRWSGGLLLRIVCAVFASISLLLSQAKIAIVVGALGSIAIIVVRRRRIAYTPARCLLGFLVLLVLAAAVISVGIALVLGRGAVVATGTLLERWYLASAAVDVLQTHPWVALFGGANAADLEVGTGLAVHNVFLANALEHGVVGALLFGMIFVQALRQRSEGAWRYAIPVLSLLTLLMAEPGIGTQMQLLVFFYAGLATSYSLVFSVHHDRARRYGSNVTAEARKPA